MRISPSRAPPTITSIGNSEVFAVVEIPGPVALFVLLVANEVLDEVFVVPDVITRVGPAEVFIVPEVTTNRVDSVLSLFGEPMTDIDISPVFVPTTKLPEIVPLVITHVCEAMLSVLPPETKMAHAVSEAENPEPLTITVVPGGPKLGFSVIVGSDVCAFS